MKYFAKTSVKKKEKDTGKIITIQSNLNKRHGGEYILRTFFNLIFFFNLHYS